MTYLLAQLWPWILLSGVIGLATGWWIWRAPADVEGTIAAPYIPPAPREEEPIEEAPAQSVALGAAPEPVEPAEAEPPAIETFDEAEDVAETALHIEARPLEEVETEPPAGAEQTPAPSPFLDAPDGEPDNLTRIKGVGPKLNDMLHALGVYHYRQIAAWTAADIAEVDSRLGTFQGRIERDRWIDQARYLAANDMVAFRREFGKPRGEL